jgi:RHS repeat-associated protein
MRYRAFGATRFTSGVTPTTFRYTGQREEAGLGLYYYGARWYDPALGRFVQADTIVPNPGDPQAFDRYAYVNNNPLKYIDPSGHTGKAIHDSNGGPPSLLSYDDFFHIQTAYYNLAVAYTNLPSDVQQTLDLYKQTYGSTEAGYVDMGPGATSQAGTVRDPAVIGASAAAGWRLGRLALQTLGLACSGGDCGSRAQTATVAAQRTGSRVQISVNWLEGQGGRVAHIMDAKHEWGRLTILTGDLQKDYKLVQPFIQETIATGTRSVINRSQLGPVVEFMKVIKNEVVVVRAVQTAEKAFRITDAWVKQ